MDDGLRINDLTQVFIGAGAGAKLSDPLSANSAPPRFNHHYSNSAAKKPVYIKAESNADCTHKCFDPIYCFFFVGCWPVVSTASARSLHEKRSVELINITLIATARYA